MQPLLVAWLPTSSHQTQSQSSRRACSHTQPQRHVQGMNSRKGHDIASRHGHQARAGKGNRVQPGPLASALDHAFRLATAKIQRTMVLTETGDDEREHSVKLFLPKMRPRRPLPSSLPLPSTLTPVELFHSLFESSSDSTFHQQSSLPQT